jgi:hypothetical protein
MASVVCVTRQADPVRWRFERALARVEPDIEAILAEHVSTYWLRGFRRREVERVGIEDVRIVWTIDGEAILELRFACGQASTLIVHDFALYEPLRKAIRTRHVRTRFATAADALITG